MRDELPHDRSSCQSLTTSIVTVTCGLVPTHGKLARPCVTAAATSASMVLLVSINVVSYNSCCAARTEEVCANFLPSPLSPLHPLQAWEEKLFLSQNCDTKRTKTWSPQVTYSATLPDVSSLQSPANPIISTSCTSRGGRNGNGLITNARDEFRIRHATHPGGDKCRIDHFANTVQCCSAAFCSTSPRNDGSFNVEKDSTPAIRTRAPRSCSCQIPVTLAEVRRWCNHEHCGERV